MILNAVQVILLVLIGIYLLLTVLAHILTWYYFARYDRRYTLTGYEPPISIVKPTKGVDYLASDCFRRFCEQDYSNKYEVLFCVEERSDPCVPTIKQIVEEYPDRARLIFSDTHNTHADRKSVV